MSEQEFSSVSDEIEAIEIKYDNRFVKDILKKKLPILKPILKWVGGKTQILDTLISEFPVEINNYHESFLGGGSVLLAVLTYVKSGIIKINGTIRAYDLNSSLIGLYKNIQSRPDEFYECLQDIINNFNDCEDGGVVNRKPTNYEEAKQSKENYYYWVRSQYNLLTIEEKQSIIGSAYFSFMNKTCFRGVFRVGPNGFNVPYGHNKNPEIINKEHLMAVHNLIQGVIFKCCSFTESLLNLEEHDYVYLDPPYAPETVTSFVKYTEDGFSFETHKKLFQMIDAITKNKIKLMMSNSSVSFVLDYFNNYYTVSHISCKRRINSKNPNAETIEVIIKNY